MTRLVKVETTLARIEPHWAAQNAYQLTFANECLFAKQQMSINKWTRETAQANPDSLKSAILNVAAIGISLNPATRHAYLVPRDGRICLDISYLGLVKLATDAGAILDCSSELVYEGDSFEWRGPYDRPVHISDVTNPDRFDADKPLEKLLGAYNIARLPDGAWKCTFMTAAEILKVKDTSKAKNGPWVNWAGEMAKKTVLKRASKSWPQGSGRARLDEAIQVLNEHEGLEEQPVTQEEKVERFMEIVANGKPTELLAFATTLTEREKNDCFNAAPKNEKTKLKNRVRQIEQEAHALIQDYTTQLTELADSGDPAALDLLEELDPHERPLVDERLTDITHRQLDELAKEAA